MHSHVKQAGRLVPSDQSASKQDQRRFNRREYCCQYCSCYCSNAGLREPPTTHDRPKLLHKHAGLADKRGSHVLAQARLDFLGEVITCAILKAMC